MITTAEVKQWGNSLGVVIPAEVVKKERLKPGEELRLDISRVKSLPELFGCLSRFPIDAQKAKDEHRRNWG